MSRSLTVSGSIELQLDALAERIAARVVELLAGQGADAVVPTADLGVHAENPSDIYDRGEPDVEAAFHDSDPGGFPVGRNHPYHPEEPLS